ncbi:MAG: hypothetical protein MR663_04945 [Lachnospiraceae bacterium]|nr:hypothetical protein [Lachnospiraceae bacterium]
MIYCFHHKKLYLNDIDGNISDYIISILAFTGNRKYINIIKSIGEKYGDLNISGAIGELESRCNISLDDPKPS